MSWPDQAARDAIATDLGATLFVEASAGSGKTTQLVARLVELVCSGRATIDQVAAITFTEAAAAELRDRLAEQLERAAGDDPGSRAARALDGLDAAAITTLHGFARRILAEHPLSAGLPAAFEVLDAFRSLVEFDERWGEMVDRLLADGGGARATQWLLACGMPLDSLRTIARRFEDNWDLLPDRRPASELPRIDAEAVLVPLRAALTLAGRCTHPEDKLLRRLVELEGWAERLAESTDEIEALSILARYDRRLGGTAGRAEHWDGAKPEVMAHLRAAQRAMDTTVVAAGSAALAFVGEALGTLTLEAADGRRKEGRLRFHDLLVLARNLVRDSVEVQRALYDKYRFLLVDEFQDTDPIQAELAVRIASAVRGDHWRSLAVEPGRLFFVGDPKQSIYRFRRANPSLFEELRGILVDEANQLTTNFRSVPGILEWVDAVVGGMIGPGYPPSSGARPACGETVPVVVLGADAEPAPKAAVSLEREAAEVAAAVLAARDEQWPVGETGRGARLGDITVLVPTRGPVAALAEAFEAAGIDYRLQSSSLVYTVPEVQGLLAVLRAVDDPTDEASVIAALRSSGFGCGDDDLLGHRRAGGGWDYRRPAPVEGPVAAGHAALRELHEARRWSPVSELVGRVVEDRRLLPLALDGPHRREGWRRLRFLLDQARQFTESSAGDLRGFLSWIDLQRDEDVRVTEVVLPEPDVEAVSVMTVHAAKGLEFPVVIVCGLGVGRRSGGVDVLFGEDGPELAVRKELTTAGHAALSLADQAQDEAERHRLLYVATTRARDHLVVSVHRAEGVNDTLAAKVHEACRDHPDRWRTLPSPAAAGAASPAAAPLDWGDPGSRRGWAARWRERMGPGAEPRTVAATRVAHLSAAAEGAEDDKAEEPGRPPWRRGRAGTAVGRAVHATLQVVDLATGEGLSDLAAAQAAAENVPERAGDVERLARAALDSQVVRAAVAGGRYWRELYVGAPVDGRVLEGVVDLLVEGRDGLEVVDYKTDQVGTEEEIDLAMGRHRLQGAAYALAVARATGRPVVGCTLLFLRPAGALVRRVADLAEATEEVTALITGR